MNDVQTQIPQLTTEQIKEKIDEFGRNVYNGIMDTGIEVMLQFDLYFDNFSCDFILESLKELGQEVTLLFNNTGDWCVAYQDKQIKDQFYFIKIPGKGWFPTIKEALKDYVKRKTTYIQMK